MAQIINARGWECPRPIIETKRLLDIMEEGEVTTIVDNQAAVGNLNTFAESMGYEAACEEREEAFFITLKKKFLEAGPVQAKEEIVIQISSDKYGTGADELGENLMKAYFYALTEVSQKPKTILFINAGVLLTADGSQVLESLKILESQGVELLSCGACLNFYGLEENLKVGEITNMYAMIEKLHGASNAIKI